jgi:epidermal growth factor receptor substrate 15
MFMACGPVSGLLDGDKAREVFLKSKLPVDKLSQIWYVRFRWDYVHKGRF